MDFTTKIAIEKADNPINYSSAIVSLGSCFAENMGRKFHYFQFQNNVNPFGIIFNPISISKLVDRAVNRCFFTATDVFFHNGLWHCYDVHSALDNPDKEALLQDLNRILEEMYSHLVQATHIIITYGTSWVYNLRSSSEIVANCHKVPQNQFEKTIISVNDTEIYIQKTIGLIQKVNPNCYFIFTVSPVRHIKDGFIENQRSKAHLITAIHNLKLPYFPSYEIMMDELRDYRFYAEDMLHPSQMAIDYIWQRFFESYISEDNYPIMEKVSDIRKALAHRPFNPDSDAHQKFLLNLKNKMQNLQQEFPHFTF